MARAVYTETIASVAADGTLKAVANVEVTIRNAEDNSIADLWNHRTASAPANELSNPFITGANGRVSFFAEGGEYEIEIHDTEAPARVADETIDWDAVAGSAAPEAMGFDMGDLKISSKTIDHGHWLRCDGRELTQAEIEGALSFSAGEAAAFVSYLGTGSSSKYGTAASSKIKLPDARRRAWIGAGASGDTTPTPPANTTAKVLGATGGVETVTLTGQQSGIAAHGHAVVDSGHTHTATQSVHGHAVTDPGHDHGGQTGPGTGLTLFIQNESNTGTSGSAPRVRRIEDESFSGTNQNEYDTHTHTVDTDDSTTGITLATAQPAITVASGTTGITVTAQTNTVASASHDNMQPYVAVGYLFIRV